MEINFLGHSGFLLESNHSIIIMDPWLSKDGAYDGGWFQYFDLKNGGKCDRNSATINAIQIN